MTKKLVLPVCILMIVFFTRVNAYSQDRSFIESKIRNFIQKIYSEDDDIQIRFGKIPVVLQGRPNVTNINFAKPPDAKGNGICLVEIVDSKTKRDRSLYIPFRLIRKTKIFVLNYNGKKGDVIRAGSVTEIATRFNENRREYPSRLEDITGRILKKDVVEGTVISYPIIDDPIVIHKGEIIDIVVENKKLFVQTKGKAMEKGRLGDSIRVKNLSSDREIVGRVVSGDKILVSF